VVGKTLTAPIERIKILLQTGDTILIQGQQTLSARQILSSVTNTQGFWSLWRGNWTNCTRIVPTYALRFTLLDKYKSLLSVRTPSRRAPLNQLIAELIPAAMSGGSTLLVTYPLDLLRTRLSADQSTHRVHTSMLRGFRGILRTEGPRGLYKGVMISLLEITPYTALSLGGYNYLKTQTLHYESDSIRMRLLLAWGSGLTGSLVCYPMDTIKRSLMLEGSAETGGQSFYKGRIRDCVKHIYAKRGIRGFYRGCALNAFKSGPATAVTLVTNDVLRQWITEPK